MWSIKYIGFLFFGGTLMFLACKGPKALSVEHIRSNADIGLPLVDSEENIIYPTCLDTEHYIPYPEDSVFFDTRWIRLNFHIMDREKRDQNFKEGSGEAEHFCYKLVENANLRLRQNFKMNLPANNDTPQLNPRYQYVIVGQDDDDDGIYYHQDDELYYFLNKGKHRTNYKRDVIKKYAVNSEEVLNVFFVPHHADSVASKTYRQTTAGIALGTDIKLGSEWNKPDRYWNYATMLNHEVGHVMSLRHSWIRNDGCDDTPSHKNCYSETKSGRCKGPTSNNMMDYNHSQMAISPCQLGRVHKVINTLSAPQRKLIVEDWCTYVPNEYLSIEKNLEWFGARDLNKDVIIKKGASLTLHCRLSMAAGSKIIVQPGGALHLKSAVLHNSCGDEWGGIELLSNQKEKGVITQEGEVQILNVITAKG